MRYTHRTWPVAAALTLLVSACAHSAGPGAGIPADAAPTPATKPAGADVPTHAAQPTQKATPSEPTTQPAPGKGSPADPTSPGHASSATHAYETVDDVTGIPRTTLSQEEEIEAGRKAAGYLRRTVGLVEDPDLQWYVQRVGAAVAARSERPDLPWYFAVLDDPAPNAFALPGGVIFVTRGMLSHLDSEAELAALLGHEIAHVAARHSISVLGQLTFPQLGSLPGSPARAAPVAANLDAGAALLFREYGRQAERQADGLGFGYALRAGYDVQEMEDIFLVLHQREQRQRMTPLPEFLATHPSTAERVALVRARLAGVAIPDDLRVGRDAYLERIDGLVYGPDPRNGFFRGTRFYHIDRRFVIQLPAEWTAHNLGRVVVAAAPDGNALIHVGVVNMSAEAAERRLLGLPGVEGRRVSDDPINGLDARLVAFRVETASGAREGLAAFIEHEGRTHEILGIAAMERFGHHGVDIVTSLSSFEPLHGDAVADVQPLRVRVVRIAEAMSVAAFAERYPSALAVDELIIVNQASHAGTRFAPGQLVKRIAGGR
jgi:predicted Zn-dependent protease